MKKFAVVIGVAVAVMLAAGSVAYAEILVLDNQHPTDLQAFGFGVVPPLLTLQAGGSDVTSLLEQGCSQPPGIGPGSDQGSQCSGPAPFNYSPIIGNTTPQDAKNTLVTLGQLGINSSAALFNLGLLFNVNEPNVTQEVTLQQLFIGIFSGNTLVGVLADLVSPVDFFNISQGQGSAGYVLGVSTAETQAFLNAHGFNSTWTLGLAAQIGCTVWQSNPSACDHAGQYSVGDGAESFTFAKLAAPIPEPATLLLLGGGLIGLGFRRFRK